MFDGKLNRVCERLLTMGKWRGTFRRVRIPIYNNHFTLPRNLGSCLGVNIEAGCCDPRTIYSRFYEFTIGACDCGTQVFPTSDTAQTFIDPTGPFTLRVENQDSADDGLELTLIGGRDVSWDEYFDSYTLELDSTTPSTSRVYQSLPRIHKPVTVGAVEMYAVNGDDEELIAIYAPSETVPAYRRYRVEASEDETLVRALCKLAFVPLVDDTDIVDPGVFNALEIGLSALTKQRAGALREGEELWAGAYKVLDDDRSELDGDATFPVIRTMGDFGAGSVLNLR